MSAPDELSKIDRLIAGQPELPPERFYNWLDSPLSLARHYGGIQYQGHHYVISVGEAGEPLVRADVLQREQKARREQEKSRRQVEKQAALGVQRGLL